MDNIYKDYIDLEEKITEFKNKVDITRYPVIIKEKLVDEDDIDLESIKIKTIISTLTDVNIVISKSSNLISDRVKRFFGIKVLNNFGKEKTRRFNDLEDANELMLKIINDLDFREVKNAKIPILGGLKIDLLTALDIVKKHINIYENYVLPGLNDLNSLVSKVMSDSDYRTRIQVDPEGDLSKYKTKSKELKDDLNKLIDSRKDEDRIQLHKLIGNLNSLKKVGQSAVEVLEYFDDIKTITTVEENIKNIKDKIVTFINIHKDNKDTVEISGNMLKKLSNYNLAMAELVNYTATLNVVSNRLVETYLRIIDILDEYR